MDGSETLAAYIEGWRPEPVTATETVSSGALADLAAVLGVEPPTESDGVPPLWYWPTFANWLHRSAIGPDGHPAAGPLLPALPNRRRAWAGGRWSGNQPLLPNTPIRCESLVATRQVKSGRSGPMLLVTVRHTLTQAAAVHVEEQDIVYWAGNTVVERPTRPVPMQTRSAPARTPECIEAGRPAPQLLDFDPVLLFRFSALTKNAHRIHYDADYARTEGYPGLVVHGPLLALVMLETVRRDPEKTVSSVKYRFKSPIFVSEPVTLAADIGPTAAKLEIQRADATCAEATIEWR